MEDISFIVAKMTQYRVFEPRNTDYSEKLISHLHSVIGSTEM